MFKMLHSPKWILVILLFASTVYASPAMKTVMVYPNYRGRMIVGGDRAIEIVGHVSLGKIGSGTVVVSLVSPDGKVINSTRKLVNAAKQFNVKLPGKKLSAGQYTLYIKISRGNSTKPFQINTYPIHVLPSNSPSLKVWIDSHNRLIVHGKPVMPIGIYTTRPVLDKTLALVKGTSFNCVMPYGWPNVKMFKKAQHAGVYLFGNLKELYYGMPGTSHLIPSPSAAGPVIRSYVRKLKDEPALLGWYINDELKPEWIPRIAKHYRWIKMLDPDHPVWMALGGGTPSSEYLRGGDIISSDVYPIATPWPQPISNVSNRVQEGVRQVANAHPVWFIPQVFNWTKFQPEFKNGKTPSSYQVRNMTWQAITSGANGIVFFAMKNGILANKDRPLKTYWPKIKNIASELAQWAPVLMSVEKSPEVTSRQAESDSNWPAWLSLRTATWHGRTFVFACNNTRKTHKAVFRTSADISHVRSIDVLDKKHKDIKANNNTWQATFKPLAVKMYELNGIGKKLPPPQDIHPPKKNG